MGFDQTAAADTLFESGQTGRLDPARTASLEGYDSASNEDGLALQLAVLERWIASGEVQGGWKIGMTSRTMRDSMGIGYRPFGYVLASRMFSSGEDVELSRISTCLIEPEMGVVIGKRLGGPDVTAEEARDAVVAVAPVYEINERRLPAGMSKPIVIGNNLGQWGIVFGPERDPNLDLRTLTLELRCDGELVGTSSTGQDVLDDPYVSIARAAQRLHGHGHAFEPGQRVITGSLLAATPIERPGQWTASYGELGEVAINFV